MADNFQVSWLEQSLVFLFFLFVWFSLPETVLGAANKLLLDLYQDMSCNSTDFNFIGPGFPLERLIA